MLIIHSNTMCVGMHFPCSKVQEMDKILKIKGYCRIVASIILIQYTTVVNQLKYVVLLIKCENMWVSIHFL